MCFERHLKDSRHFFCSHWGINVELLCVLKDIFYSQSEKKCFSKDIFHSHEEIIWMPKDSIHHTVLTKPLVFLNCSQITRWSYAPNNLFGSVEHLCKAWIKPKTTLGKTPWNITWELYLAAGAKKAQNHYQKAIWDLTLNWSQQGIN